MQSARQHPYAVSLALGLPLVLSPLVSSLLASYRGYMALGPGGFPHNVFGWAFQGLLQPLARDTLSPAPFSNPAADAEFAPHGRESFLAAPLPTRAGERPTVPGYVVPQRQTTEPAPQYVDEMNAYLSSLTKASPQLLEFRPSVLEHPSFPAVALVHPPKFVKHSEIAHVHSEGSSHVLLSLEDARSVLRTGWGQRHPISGVLMPLTYVMIYAPRDEHELEVWKNIVRASVAFTTAE